MLFDSHAHLNNEDNTPELLAELVETIERSSLDYVMDIGFDLPSSVLATEHAKAYPWCYAAVGCHPHDTKDMDDEKLEEIRALAAEEKVKAIGEIGLDYYWDASRKEEQKALFRRQIEIALARKLPVIVHDREAHGDCFEIVRDYPGLRGVFHCYSGSAEMAKELLKNGWYLGFDGPVTYKNARKTLEVLAICPPERILIETDSPYLAPVPFRGRRNSSLYLEQVARKVAEIRGIPQEEVEAVTTANAKAFFGLA